MGRRSDSFASMMPRDTRRILTGRQRDNAFLRDHSPGHSTAKMSERYSHADLEKLRASLSSTYTKSRQTVATLSPKKDKHQKISSFTKLMSAVAGSNPVSMTGSHVSLLTNLTE
jgi:hypothetical protein